MSTPNPIQNDPLGIGRAKAPAKTPTLDTGISNADQKAADELKSQIADQEKRLAEAKAQEQSLGKQDQGDGLAKAVQAVKEWKPTDTTAEYEKMASGLRVNLAKLTAPPQKELVYKAKNFKLLLPILAALAAIGTRSSGGNLAIGINAMGKGLQAFKEGNDQEYARQYKIWEDKTNQALKENQQEIMGYNEWLKSVQANDKTTLEGKISILQSMAKANQNVHMEKAAATRDIQEITRNITSLTQALARAQEHIDRAKHAMKPIRVTPDVASAVKAITAADKYLPPLETVDDSGVKHINPQVLLLQSKLESLAAQAMREDPRLTPAAAAAQAQVEALQQGIYSQEGFTNEPHAQ